MAPDQSDLCKRFVDSVNAYPIQIRRTRPEQSDAD